MAFKTLAPVQERKAAASGCRAGLVAYKNAKSVKLTVTIAGKLRDEMGLAGDVHLAVLVGEDEDHGLLRIRKVSDASDATLTSQERHAARGKSTFYKLDLGAIDLFVNSAQKMQPVKWEKLEDGWFEIVLPEWAEETRPKSKHAVAAVPPALANAKRAGDADRQREENERREAAERRKSRELFGDKLGDKVANAR